METEYHVLRAVVLSIVATLAVGPNAELLCSAWCHPQAAASSASHHDVPSAAASGASHHGEPSAGSSMAGDDACDKCDNAVGAVQFLLENLRRIASDPDVDHAVLVPRYQLAHPTIAGRPGLEPGREGSIEARRLLTILRV